MQMFKVGRRGGRSGRIHASQLPLTRSRLTLYLCLPCQAGLTHVGSTVNSKRVWAGYYGCTYDPAQGTASRNPSNSGNGDDGAGLSTANDVFGTFGIVWGISNGRTSVLSARGALLSKPSY